jgi:hypothetical protein
MITLRRRFSRAGPARGCVLVVPKANPCKHAVYVVCPRQELSDEELRLAAINSGTFAFWKGAEEDIYTLDDGEPV